VGGSTETIREAFDLNPRDGSRQSIWPKRSRAQKYEEAVRTCDLAIELRR
jgi:hypothetical protein